MSAIRAKRTGLFNKGQTVRSDPLLRCVDEIVLVDLDDAVELPGEPGERFSLELPHALPVEAELLPDRLERRGLTNEAEAQLEDATLALGQPVQCLPDGMPLV